MNIISQKTRKYDMVRLSENNAGKYEFYSYIKGISEKGIFDSKSEAKKAYKKAYNKMMGIS